MNKMIKFPLILALTGTICATALGVVYQIANPIIEERVNAAANAVISTVLPGAKGSDITKKYSDKSDIIKKYNISTIYEIKKDGKVIGNGFKLSGAGFKSQIETMVILDDTKILGVKVLNHGETDNKFKLVIDAKFEESYTNKKFEDAEKFDKVSGATYSSKGIHTAVMNARDAYKEIILGETVGPKEVVTTEELTKLGYEGETIVKATDEFMKVQGDKYKTKFVGTQKDRNNITDAFYRKNSAGEIVGYVYYFEPKYNCEVTDGARVDQTYRGLYAFDKDGSNTKLVILESADSLPTIGKPSLQDMELLDSLQGFNISEVKDQSADIPDKVAGSTFTSKSIVNVVKTICLNHKDF